MKSGSPDDATKILLAELIQEIISSVTNTLLTAQSLRRMFCPAFSSSGHSGSSRQRQLEKLVGLDSNGGERKR